VDDVSAPDQFSERPRRAGERYARFYPAIAVVLFVLSFFPLYDDTVVRDGDVTEVTHYGSVFELAGEDQGGPAVVGILLLAVLIIVLAIGSARSASALLAATIAIFASLVAIMVLAEPGTGTPAPAVSDPGAAGAALTIATAVWAILHAVHVAVLKKSTRSAAFGDRPSSWS
jgi:hypothetical protein